MSAMGYRNIGFRFAPEVQKLGVTGVFFTVGALRNRQRDPEFDSLFDSEIQWLLASGQPESLVQDPMWITKTFDASAARTTMTAGGALLATEPGDTTAALFGAAVDIGTTTLVVALIDLRDGRELAIASSLNPQARHAQDVLSRIKLGSQPQGLQLLHGELIAELNCLVGAAAAEADVPVRHIYEAVFSGNTTMLHLATATNPASLGKYPYTPALQGGQHVSAADIGLVMAPRGLVYLPPIMSAYVGADITSGILATKLAEQRGVTLFVDIGTNGEMVLAANGQLTATSTAAGPAFEGMNIACGMRASRGAIEQVSLSGNDVEIKTIANAEPVGLCGSGLLDVVGELAAHGGVDKNGRFETNGSLPDRQWKDRFGSLDGKARLPHRRSGLSVAERCAPGAIGQGRRSRRNRTPAPLPRPSRRTGGSRVDRRFIRLSSAHREPDPSWPVASRVQRPGGVCRQHVQIRCPRLFAEPTFARRTQTTGATRSRARTGQRSGVQENLRQGTFILTFP